MMSKHFLIPLFALLLCSCQHKELCYDHSHMVTLDVRFDWSEAPDAAPTTMVLQIFHSDGSRYTTEEFVSREGGTIKIEEGEYKFLFHNGTMSSLVEQGDTYDHYELTTKSQSLLAPLGTENVQNVPRPGDAEDEPVIDVLEQVWGGSLDAIRVVRGVQGQSVTLKPLEATAEYTVEVREVKNLRDDIVISGAVTGMAQSWRISDNTLSEMTATIPFGLTRKDETSLEAHFIIFGDSPGHTGTHKLSIYTSQKDYAHFDVTDQVHGAADRRHVRITVAGIELKDPDGGMSPDISGWEDVEIDIPMQ